MTHASEETVLKFLDRLDAGDLDGALAHCSYDVSYAIPGRSSISGEHRGAAAIRAALSVAPRHGATELTTRVQELVAGESTAVSVHELTGTLDGRPMQYELVLRYRLAGSQIARIVEYTNDQYLADELFMPPAQAEAPVRWWRRLRRRRS